MITIEKNHQLLPCKIRPYLIPFMEKEFAVKDQALFGGVMAKIVDISLHNSFGKIIRMMCDKAYRPERELQKFSVFIRVKNSYTKKQWEGQIYKYASGEYSFLHLPSEGVEIINDHFEGIFSQSLLFYLEGHQNGDSDQGLRKGIDLFMQKYSLYDFDVDPEALRRAYYRYVNEHKRLSFFCTKKSRRNIKIN